MHGGEAAVLLDAAGRIAHANAAAFELGGDESGFTYRRELVGLAAPRSRTTLQAAIERAASGERCTLQLELQTGPRTRISARAELLPAIIDDTIVGVYALFRTAPSRHDALAERLHELALQYERHVDALIVLDTTGRCILVNPAWERLTGYAVSEYCGRYRVDVVTPDSTDHAEALFARVLAGEALSAQIRILRKDGRPIDFDSQAAPLTIDGAIVGICAVGHDVTERRRLEVSLREQNERMAELCLIASWSGRRTAEQIEAALEVGRKRLGCAVGYVSCAGAGGIRRLYTAGENVPPEHSDRYSWISVPLTVGGRQFGSLVFGDVLERPAALRASDRDFVGLIGALVASAIERRDQRKSLADLAFYDSLTALPNRALVSERLSAAITEAQRDGGSFAVHFIDLDGFKAVNDALGHAGGDDVLRLAARRLREEADRDETVGRIGGDEFVVIQPEAGAVEAAGLASRLRRRLAEPFAVSGVRRKISASVGVALYPKDGQDAATLLGNADTALYRIKASGRDGAALFTPDPPP